MRARLAGVATSLRILTAVIVTSVGGGPPAHADEADRAGGDPGPPREGRGFVFGIGFGPGGMRFADADRAALFVGPPMGTEGGCSYGTCFLTQVRSARVAPRGATVPGTEMVVAIPASESVGSLTVVAGWSFSPRIAALLDLDLAGRWKGDGFEHILGGVVLRYSPAARVWVEAGPSFGDLDYVFNSGSSELGFTNEAARVHGDGALAAAGYEIVRRRTWRVDVQVRGTAMWFDEMRTTTVSLLLGIHRRRS